jgi:hypothetical protein
VHWLLVARRRSRRRPLTERRAASVIAGRRAVPQWQASVPMQNLCVEDRSSNISALRHAGTFGCEQGSFRTAYCDGPSTQLRWSCSGPPDPSLAALSVAQTPKINHHLRRLGAINHFAPSTGNPGHHIPRLTTSAIATRDAARTVARRQAVGGANSRDIVPRDVPVGCYKICLCLHLTACDRGAETATPSAPCK